MKVAVVRNSERSEVINRFGQVCPEVYSAKTIRSVMDALIAGGHAVVVVEGDKRLLSVIEQLIPDGLVFNMAYGIQGQSRYTHVPAMLELAGIPYTGSGPLGHAIALDKVVTKNLLEQAGVTTPGYAVMSRPDAPAPALRYPVVVKPRHESTSYGLRLVENRNELRDAVAAVIATYEQDALVEEYVDGREICAGLLGNDEVEFLPFVEADFGARPMRLVTFDDKYHLSGAELEKICPALVNVELGAKLRDISLAAFRACHCQDYSRVDIRVDRGGNPYVLEINSMASLGAGGSYVRAALAAGYTYTTLVNRIVEVAMERYAARATPLTKPEMQSAASADASNR
jgi:D-alanine-D-alanine ligase